MRQRKLRIYLDTSVISYHTARPHLDPVVRSRQLITKRWWNLFVRTHRFFVSPYVLGEIGKGSPEAAERRIKAVSGLQMLRPGKGSIDLLAKRLARELNLPVKSPLDAYHLAIAAVEGQDYIVSWNFKHMANADVRRVYRSICLGKGLVAPEISTPEEMLEQEG